MTPVEPSSPPEAVRVALPVNAQAYITTLEQPVILVQQRVQTISARVAEPERRLG